MNDLLIKRLRKAVFEYGETDLAPNSAPALMMEAITALQEAVEVLEFVRERTEEKTMLLFLNKHIARIKEAEDEC